MTTCYWIRTGNFHIFPKDAIVVFNTDTDKQNEMGTNPFSWIFLVWQKYKLMNAGAHGGYTKQCFEHGDVEKQDSVFIRDNMKLVGVEIGMSFFIR